LYIGAKIVRGGRRKEEAGGRIEGSKNRRFEGRGEGLKNSY